VSITPSIVGRCYECIMPTKHTNRNCFWMTIAATSSNDAEYSAGGEYGSASLTAAAPPPLSATAATPPEVLAVAGRRPVYSSCVGPRPDTPIVLATAKPEKNLPSPSVVNSLRRRSTRSARLHANQGGQRSCGHWNQHQTSTGERRGAKQSDIGNMYVHVCVSVADWLAHIPSRHQGLA
jgi:hypothetical protein